MQLKHKVIAGVTIFAGVAATLWILKLGQTKSIPGLSQIANAVTPTPAASTVAAAPTAAAS